MFLLEFRTQTNNCVFCRQNICSVELAVGSLPTPHLNRKKLSTNSSWDFKYVLETMGDYWVGPDENFCPESTRTGGTVIIFPNSGRNQNLTPL